MDVRPAAAERGRHDRRQADALVRVASATPLGTTALMRRFLLWLAAASAAGTAVELAMLRHWKSLDQLVPWVALAAAAVAIWLVARPTRRAIRTARVLALAVALTAAVGLAEHVVANYEAGPLDVGYAATWDSMSELSRWLVAVTETVGPSPPIAPGVLAQIGLAVLIATIRHPALEPPDGRAGD
jgi:hypothetical protein